MQLSKSAMALAILLSTAAQTAWAQEQPAAEDNEGLDEIVVTAQRREQLLQDVPVAVSSISAEQLSNRGVTSLANLNTGTVPGLVVFKSAGIATQLGLNIRGVTVSDPGQGTVEQGVPVYIDGVYLGRSQGLGMDLAEPERIEVLRGPQGTLFGRNAEGGAVQIITRRPSGELQLSTEATIGNFEYTRLLAHLDLPEFAGISLRVSGLLSELGGYVENTPSNPALSAQENFGLEDNSGWRLAAHWEATPNFFVDYSYDSSRSEYTSQYFQYNNRTGVPIGAHLPEPGRVDQSWLPMWLDRLSTEAAGHTLTATWDINDSITLRSITSFRTLEDGGFNQTAGALSFSPQAGVPIPGNAPLLSYGRTGIAAAAFLDQEQRSQEFQLIGSAPRLEYTAGVFYYHEEVSDTRLTGATIYYTSPGPSNPVSVNPVIIAQPNVNVVDSQSYAAFGQATWTPPVLNDRLELTLGLRYSVDDKLAQRVVAGGVPLAVPLQSAYDGQRWDPVAVIQYNFDDDTQAYLRYATGYRAGGVAVRSPTFRSYEEETATTWELGYKTNFGPRSRLNLALFHNEINGYQINTLVDPAVNISLVDTINIPVPYTVRGIEAEFEWRPIDPLHLQISYAFSDEEDPSYEVAGVPVRIVQPGVPEHMVSLSADYEVPLSFADLVFHLDYQYSDEYYRPNVATAGTDAAYFPTTLDVLNGRITLRDMQIGGGDVSLALWFKNILDTEDVLFSSTAGGYVLSDPRTFGLTLRARY